MPEQDENVVTVLLFVYFVNLRNVLNLRFQIQVDKQIKALTGKFVNNEVKI